MLCTVVNKYKDAFDIYIGRGSKWGNPFIIGKDGDRRAVIDKYREYVLGRHDLMSALHELDGKVIGCFCKPKPCHGDVLAELVARLLKE